MERETPTRVGDALPTFLAAARGMSFKRVTVGQERTHRTLHTTTTAAAATPLAVNETEQWRGARGVGRRGGKTPFSFSTPMHPFSLSLARSLSPRFSPFLIEGRWGRASPLAATAHTGFTGTVYPLGSVQRSLFLIPLLTRTLSLSLSSSPLFPRSVRKIDGLGRREREREMKLKRRRARRRWRRRRVSDD